MVLLCLLLLAGLAVALWRVPEATLDVPTFGAHFVTFTNGVFGKRFAVVVLTNRADRPLRLFEQPVELDYGPPFNMPMPNVPVRTSGLGDAVVNPHETITVTVEVITDPGPASPRMLLRFSVEEATTRERLIREWEKRLQTDDGWIQWIPMDPPKIRSVIAATEWFGP